MNSELRDILKSHLSSPAHSWSIGIPGAIGEFMYDENEAAEISESEECISALTSRGAIQIRFHPELTCFAHEELSSCTKSWSQNLSFCLDKKHAELGINHEVSCLGEDVDALDANARSSLLFDLGVGSPWVRFCVRSAEGELLDALHASCGHSVFDQAKPAGAAVLEYSPTRVVISALGRVEVETPIPKTATEVDFGPHTHLLPYLLKAKKTGAAGIPVSYVECLALYPEHPAHDKYGESCQFSASSFQHFQSLLEKFGSSEYLAARNYCRENEGGKQAPGIDTDNALHQQLSRIYAIQAEFQEAG